MAQLTSLDLHKIRVGRRETGRQGARGLMETQQERSWSPPPQSPPPLITMETELAAPRGSHPPRA